MNIKKDFPIFKEKFQNKPLIYLDNAATTQKPQQVINTLIDFYTKYNANVHRNIYNFGEYTTVLFEESRNIIAQFINAHPNEVVFTTGTTGSINFVAFSWGQQNIKENDEIIISQMEHHSNIIPWQQLAKLKKAKLKVIPLTQDYKLDLEAYESLLNNKTKLVAITHVSNVLGTTNDINLVTKRAHQIGAKVLIDAAQSVAHQKIDIKEIDCDFLAFSGHKLLGPTGIGVLFIKNLLHNQIEPIKFGGGMVFETNFENSSWLQSPHKFEAGTPPIAQALGLASAISYINKSINFAELQKFEANLCKRFIEGLSKFKKIRIIGPIEQLKKMGHIVSFTVEACPLKLSERSRGFHPHDIAAYLDSFGICVRAGHHCAQPLHQALGIEATVRVSFYGYNQIQEVNLLLDKISELL